MNAIQNIFAYLGSIGTKRKSDQVSGEETSTKNSEPAPTLSLKRKAEDELKNDKNIKRRRLSLRIANKERYDGANTTPVTSDADDMLSIDECESDEESDLIPIEDILAPQEKFLLRADPWNHNFLASTWANDMTLLISHRNSKENPKFEDAQCSGILPEDIWGCVLEYFGLSEIVKMSTISKWHRQRYYDTPIQVWKDYFKSRRWRLPHEIFNSILTSQIVINEEKIDWINETKRNYLNDRRIAELVTDITEKIRRITGEPNLELFEPGLSDEELDQWEMEEKAILPNELRALFKICSKPLWGLVHQRHNSTLKNIRHAVHCDYSEYDVEIPYLVIPSIEEISPGGYYHLSYYEKLEEGGFCPPLDSEESGEEKSDFKLELRPQISYEKKELVLHEDDLLSDSTEYEPSISEISSEDCPSTDNCVIEEKADEAQNTPKIYSNAESESEEGYSLPPSYGSINATPANFESSSSSSSASRPRTKVDYRLWAIGTREFSNMSSEDEYDIIYDPLSGAISTAEKHYVDTFETDYLGTLVDLLQRISDYLDDIRAPLWLECSNWKIDPQKVDIEDLLEDHADEWEPFEQLATEVNQFIKPDQYFHPRAMKLLANSAKQFIVDVFAKAQTMETTEVLQPDTFIAAANQMKFQNATFVRETKDLGDRSGSEADPY